MSSSHFATAEPVIAYSPKSTSGQHTAKLRPGKRLPVGENTQEVQCQRRAEKRQRKVIQDRAVKLHGEQRLRDAEQVGQAQDTDNKPLREAQTLGLPHRS